MNKIPLGRLVMTRGVADFFDEHPKIMTMMWGWLGLHQTGECPYLDEEDQATNHAAIQYGNRVLTAWPTGMDGEQKKIWIITEADRSSTTLLFPDEY